MVCEIKVIGSVMTLILVVMRIDGSGEGAEGKEKNVVVRGKLPSEMAVNGT